MGIPESKTTTPLERSLKNATSADFIVRPSHYRARLDENGGVIDRHQRVLCGALNSAGRFTCGEKIASVLVRGRSMNYRELIIGPGWIIAVGHSTQRLDI